MSCLCSAAEGQPTAPTALEYCGFTVHRHWGAKKAMNFRLVSAFTQNYRGRRLKKNSQVQPDRPISCVLQVQADHVVKSGAAATFHLPQARNSRLELKHHPAELQNSERFAILAQSFLLEEHRSL